MNELKPTDSIQNAVLEKVRAGSVRRLPRFYFMLRIIATAAVSILLLVASSLVSSFILFSLHESGEQFLLGFGLQGIKVFLTLFPWTLTLLVAALIFLLEWLLRGFRFGYRIPVLAIFLGILGSSIVLGVFISLTPLHSHLLQYADDDRLPIVGPIYEHIFDAHENHGVSRGVVVATTSNSFVIQHNDQDRDPDDGSFTIHLSHNLAVPQVGQHVLVFGAPQPDGSINAQNIVADQGH
jgi:hypothetical protein